MNHKQQTLEKRWYQLEELRPDQLEQVMTETPLVYWPLGVIEHHGWHLPVGFDGIKARRFCELAAAQTGGLMMPPFWWGGLGGHGAFRWTFYQDPAAAQEICCSVIRQLIGFGARVIVLFYGHYPWEQLVNTAGGLDRVRKDFPNVTIIEGTEVTIAGGPSSILPPGDHGARQESTYGMHLMPELMDIGALVHGRSEKQAWGNSPVPPEHQRHPGVDFDASSPFFAQMGESPLLCTQEASEKQSRYVVQQLVEKVNTVLF